MSPPAPFNPKYSPHSPTNNSSPPQRRIPARRRDLDKDYGLSPHALTVRYLAALSFIALLVVAGQGLIQHFLSRQEDRSRTINLAGRQRMLYQALSKTALALSVAADPEVRRELRSELRENLDLWSRTHQGLLRGDAELGLSGQKSPAVETLFDKLEPSRRAIHQAASELAAGHGNEEEDRTGALYRNIHDRGDEYIRLMNLIVFQYDSDLGQWVRRLRAMSLALAVLLLAVLGLEARFIFRPAARRIRRDMAELAAAAEELKRLSYLDGLTQVANRRLFDERLEEDWKRAAR
ncbi:MAG: type IV pili methyl-accepting chemotaxis transducer N-terminal domain-containing protein, partial [Thermodesulfobacteriota bacterium]